MKIHSLHIYGFGKWENYSLDLSKDLTVIYGENEAGKTTIMSFLHFVLFGFSSKVQEEKYRPKTIHAYGGKVTLTFNDAQVIQVERVKLEKNEKLTIKDSNGQDISEDIYKQWMKNMDEAYFESIFSFNQLSLQRISELKGEDLNKYLFSSSVVGSDQLYKVEKMIDKQMDELFKKKGKNQKIAKLLVELTSHYEKQQIYQQNLEQYNEDIQKVSELTQKIEEIEKEIDRILIQLSNKKQLVELKEIIFEVNELENQLKNIQTLLITEEEMSLFQQLKAQLVNLQQELDELQIEMNVNKEKLEQLRIKQITNNQLQELDELLQLGKIYEDRQKEHSLIQNQLQLLDNQLNELHLQEGFSLPKEQLITLNSNSLLKEEITKMVSENNIVESNLKQTTDELEQLKIAIDKKEEVIDSIQTQLLPDHERETLQSIVDHQQEIKDQEAKKQFILQQLDQKQAIYKTEIKLKKKNKQRQKKIAISFLFIGIIALFTYLFFIKETWMLISSILILIVGCTFLFLKMNAKQVELLKADIEYLERSLKEYPTYVANTEELIHAKKQLEVQSEILKNLQLEQSKLDDLFVSLDRLDHQYLKWQQEYKQLQQKKNQILSNWQLAESYEMNQLPILLDLIVKYKGLYLEKKNKLELYQQQQQWLQKVEEKIEQFAHIFAIEEVRDKNFLLNELNRKRLEAMQINSSMEERITALEKMELTFQQKTKSDEILLQKLKDLMESKSLIKEDDFYMAYEISKEKKEKELRLAHLKLTLKSTNIDPNVINEFLKQPVENKELMELENQLENYKLTKNQLLEEKIKLTNDIRFIEEGKSLETITQDYEITKAEYEQTVEKWLELAIAKKKLQRTIRFYMEEKLPHILKVASNHFQYLTNENYTDILFNEESQFYVKHQSGEFFTIHQLSQSTKEQVYISLRLALANHIFEHDYFPLVIDDGFVHFDKNRTKNMLTLLQNLSDHQVILFTCHEHIRNQISDQQTITIS